ncbi:MAG TPA: glycoside hydrolase family 43 protein [Lachnospiraceae bacterium]|nr:glycoside hydrolase family 43 protein [Lachnospiraceae bacterium]
MSGSKKLKVFVLLFILILESLTACAKPGKKDSNQDIVTESKVTSKQEVDAESKEGKEGKKMQSSRILEEELKSYFIKMPLSDTMKVIEHNNPLITQRLGADPYAIVYNGRVYIYMTGDVVEYDADGKGKANSYGKIDTLNVISSSDLVNWTDHGKIYAAGRRGAAKWGNNSWAPAVAYKKIDGKDKFFIYFANGGNGIGVLTSDSPTGPFEDPLGCALVSRDTPNCSSVAWLFDPAVFVDQDGKAYLYFGGGIPEGKTADPGTARVVQLGEDMISLAMDPVRIDVPYLFEDSGINRIGDTYYYSYCTNWEVDPKDAKSLGINSAQIAYMTSSNPFGPFTLKGSILRNPGDFFGCYGNNHHCIFTFKDQWYITYHTQILEERLGISGGYRCTHIDPVTIDENGSIKEIQATETGVNQVEYLNPYIKNEAETMATMGGIDTAQLKKSTSETGNIVVTDINSGDWIAVKGVDFGANPAQTFTATVKPSSSEMGAVQIRLDGLSGKVIGYLKIESEDTNDTMDVTTELIEGITGIHDLYFVFHGEGYQFDSWMFK